MNGIWQGPLSGRKDPTVAMSHSVLENCSRSVKTVRERSLIEMRPLSVSLRSIEFLNKLRMKVFDFLHRSFI